MQRLRELRVLRGNGLFFVCDCRQLRAQRVHLPHVLDFYPALRVFHSTLLLLLRAGLRSGHGPLLALLCVASQAFHCNPVVPGRRVHVFLVTPQRGFQVFLVAGAQVLKLPLQRRHRAVLASDGVL